MLSVEQVIELSGDLRRAACKQLLERPEQTVLLCVLITPQGPQPVMLGNPSHKATISAAFRAVARMRQASAAVTIIEMWMSQELLPGELPSQSRSRIEGLLCMVEDARAPSRRYWVCPFRRQPALQHKPWA